MIHNTKLMVLKPLIRLSTYFHIGNNNTIVIPITMEITIASIWLCHCGTLIAPAAMSIMMPESNNTMKPNFCRSGVWMVPFILFFHTMSGRNFPNMAMPMDAMPAMISVIRIETVFIFLFFM